MSGSVLTQNAVGPSPLSTASHQSAGGTSNGSGAPSFANMLQDGVTHANRSRPRQGRDPSGGDRSPDGEARVGPKATPSQDQSGDDQASATSSRHDTGAASSAPAGGTQHRAGGAKHTPDSSQNREEKAAVERAGQGQEQVSDPGSGGQSVANNGNNSPQTGDDKQDISATDASPTAAGQDENAPPSPGALSAGDDPAAKPETGDAERRKSSRRDRDSAVAGVSATGAVPPLPGLAPGAAPGGEAGPTARGSGTQEPQQPAASVPKGESRTGGLSTEEEGGPSQGSLEQGARVTKDPANGLSGRNIGANGVSAQSTAGTAATGSPASALHADASSTAQAAGLRHLADAVQPASPQGLSKSDGLSHHAGADSPVPASAGTSALDQLAGAGRGTHDGLQAPIDPTLAGASLGATGATSHGAFLSPLASGTYHTSLSVNASSWPDDLGNQVIWMVGNHISSADLTLNPPGLGKMEIRVSLEDDKTKVSFNVHNGVARDAVAGTLPRLRELFQQAGVNLQQVDVAEHQSGSNQGGAGSQFGQAGTGGGQEQSGAPITIQSLPGLSGRALPDSMIDAYA